MTTREPATEMSCRELVALVTDYLEGALTPGERHRFDEHLAGCDACEEYLAQFRATIAATGTLREEEVPPRAREARLRRLAGWSAGS